eukprot:11991913-Alexandrium_andersonii.AAC.1
MVPVVIARITWLLACLPLSCKTRSGAALHMWWLCCTYEGAPPSRVFPWALSRSSRQPEGMLVPKCGHSMGRLTLQKVSVWEGRVESEGSIFAVSRVRSG